MPCLLLLAVSWSLLAGVSFTPDLVHFANACNLCPRKSNNCNGLYYYFFWPPDPKPDNSAVYLGYTYRKPIREGFFMNGNTKVYGLHSAVFVGNALVDRSSPFIFSVKNSVHRGGKTHDTMGWRVTGVDESLDLTQDVWGRMIITFENVRVEKRNGDTAIVIAKKLTPGSVVSITGVSFAAAAQVMPPASGIAWEFDRTLCCAIAFYSSVIPENVRITIKNNFMTYQCGLTSQRLNSPFMIGAANVSTKTGRNVKLAISGNIIKYGCTATAAATCDTHGIFLGSLTVGPGNEIDVSDNEVTGNMGANLNLRSFTFAPNADPRDEPSTLTVNNNKFTYNSDPLPSTFGIHHSIDLAPTANYPVLLAAKLRRGNDLH